MRRGRRPEQSRGEAGVLFCSLRLALAKNPIRCDPKRNEITFHDVGLARSSDRRGCSTAEDDLGFRISTSEIDHNGQWFGVLLEHDRTYISMTNRIIRATQNYDALNVGGVHLLRKTLLQRCQEHIPKRAQG